MEEMESVKKYFREKDLFAAYTQVEVMEVSPGYAKAKVELEDHHFNGVHTVHGGMIFTLADIAFAAASNSHGSVSVAINVNISFVKAATAGTLYAQAREQSINPKIASYGVEVTDEAGELIAVFQGLVYRKKAKLEEYL